MTGCIVSVSTDRKYFMTSYQIRTKSLSLHLAIVLNRNLGLQIIIVQLKARGEYGKNVSKQLWAKIGL